MCSDPFFSVSNTCPTLGTVTALGRQALGEQGAVPALLIAVCFVSFSRYCVVFLRFVEQAGDKEPSVRLMALRALISQTTHREGTLHVLAAKGIPALIARCASETSAILVRLPLSCVPKSRYVLPRGC
jgi:hypothetical protein